MGCQWKPQYPASEIKCTNVLPELGVKVVRANGEAIGEDPSIDDVSQVRIKHSSYVPGGKATFLEAELETSLFGCPCLCLRQILGLASYYRRLPLILEDRISVTQSAET